MVWLRLPDRAHYFTATQQHFIQNEILKKNVYFFIFLNKIESILRCHQDGFMEVSLAATEGMFFMVGGVKQ